MRHPRILAAAGLLVLSAVAAPALARTADTSDDSVDQSATALLSRPTLNKPTTVTVSPLNPVVTLNKSRDYIVRVPTDAVFLSGVAIVGGHNVVLESATIRYVSPLDTPGWYVRGLFLKGQTGVMYLNGVKIRGPLKDGIQMDERAPDAAVVLRNIDVDPVWGSYRGYHADVLQTWAGPSKLVVDGLTGTSDYQGFFLPPNQLWPDGPKPQFFWFRNVHLDVSTGYYALWTEGFGAFPVVVHGVYVKPHTANRDAWLWPKPSTGDTTWTDVVAN
jgi:hypothetical protein